MSSYETALSADPAVADLIGQELHRQQTTLQLIASENFTSPAVLAASGSVLTNKYSEGYPGRRYYGGNQIIDEVEDLARDRATELFGAEHANVQPHAGANANLAAYQALLEPGATILAMRLDHGGHLTHGSPASIVSKFWRFVSYGVTPASSDEANPGEVIDFDQVAHLAKTEKPALIVAGSTAYARIIDPVPFREIADSVGAYFMFDAAHPAGLIAGGAHPNPVGVADVVTLTTHKTLRGPARRRHSVRRGPGQEDRQLGLPRPPGRSARTRHRRKGSRLRRGRPAGVPSLRGCRGRKRIRLGGCIGRPRFPARLGWDRQPHAAGRSAPLRCGAHGQGGPGGARSRRDHSEPQHDPRRPRSPFLTSGLRMGTAAETTAGMGPEQMAVVAELVARTLKARTDEGEVAAIRREVAELCAAFPPYPDLVG